MGRYEIATGRVPKEEPEPVNPSKKKELKDGQVVKTIHIINSRRPNRNNVIYSTSPSVSELNNMSSEELSRLWPTE
jgi:hypothetical protein